MQLINYFAADKKLQVVDILGGSQSLYSNNNNY